MYGVCTYDEAYLPDVSDHRIRVFDIVVQTLSHGSASRSGAIRSNALHTLFTTMDILAEYGTHTR